MVTLNDDILEKKVAVVPINSRGHVQMIKKDLDRAMELMVVVFVPSEKFYFHKIVFNFLKIPTVFNFLQISALFLKPSKNIQFKQRQQPLFKKMTEK